MAVCRFDNAGLGGSACYTLTPNGAPNFSQSSGKGTGFFRAGDAAIESDTTSRGSGIATGTQIRYDAPVGVIGVPGRAMALPSKKAESNAGKTQTKGVAMNNAGFRQ